MKKTLVALSILAAATSAQAIELYNQDGVTVDIHGDIEVTYQNSFTESSMKQQIEDADFGFDVRYALNDDLQFGGYWAFDGSESNNAEVTRSGDVYVALYSKTYGSIKFGRLCTAVDDLGGITSDYQFDVNKLYEAGSDDVTCADEAIRYDYDNGTFYTTLGFIQDKLGHSDLYTGEIVDDGNGNPVLEKVSGSDFNYYDGRFGYRVADLDMSVFIANLNFEDNSKGNDETAYGFEANYRGIESIRLGLGYYVADIDEAAGEANQDTNVITLGADYYLGKWTFATAVSTSDHDNDKLDSTNWFVNAGYNLAPNTTAYIEYAGQDVDGKKDSEDALAIGVKASF
ncbi:porin [Vibrio ponticus]|uniref:Porin n=1 Tax=Vibrio ponticus TaxID=265668 RepID=A0ABX3FB53_9VIBR|nr:porin [Vibrio ponticus]OLQ86233.1 porin [Vibrio ponticus]